MCNWYKIEEFKANSIPLKFLENKTYYKLRSIILVWVIWILFRFIVLPCFKFIWIVFVWNCVNFKVELSQSNLKSNTTLDQTPPKPNPLNPHTQPSLAAQAGQKAELDPSG